MADSSFAQPLLIDTDWLNEHREDSGVVMLDATTFLDQPEGDGYYTVTSGRQAYERGHIPGAVHADLLHDLADQNAATTFTALPSDEFAARIGELGVSNDSHVVIYDQGPMMWAARLWWNLRLEGHDTVSVLDGGFAAWEQAGLPVATGTDTNPPATFHATRRPELYADRDRVLNAIDDDATLLINSLDEPTFTGNRVTYARPGHIPGSVNVPFQDLVTGTGTAASPEAVEGKYEAVGALAEDRTPITYCGSGIAASFEAFQLARLGRTDVAVYDGSMTEWAADPSLPLDTDS